MRTAVPLNKMVFKIQNGCRMLSRGRVLGHAYRRCPVAPASLTYLSLSSPRRGAQLPPNFKAVHHLDSRTQAKLGPRWRVDPYQQDWLCVSLNAFAFRLPFYFGVTTQCRQWTTTLLHQHIWTLSQDCTVSMQLKSLWNSGVGWDVQCMSFLQKNTLENVPRLCFPPFPTRLNRPDSYSHVLTQGLFCSWGDNGDWWLGWIHSLSLSLSLSEHSEPRSSSWVLLKAERQWEGMGVLMEGRRCLLLLSKEPPQPHTGTSSAMTNCVGRRRLCTKL